MDISKVGSITDLASLYKEKDKNNNGLLEANELSKREVATYDKSGDNALSHWEVMEAVNRIKRKQIFSRIKIKYAKKYGTIPNILLKTDKIIQGIKYKGGKKVYFRKNGQALQGILAENTVIKVGNQKIKFKAGTLVLFDNYGKVAVATLLKETKIKINATETAYLKGNSQVQFVNGVFASGMLARPFTYLSGKLSIILPPNTEMICSANLPSYARLGAKAIISVAGKLGTLRKTIKIELKTGTYISFSRKQWITTLSKDAKNISLNKIIKAGSKIIFNTRGYYAILSRP